MFEFKNTENRSCTRKKIGKRLSHLACALALILLIMPISSALAAPTANDIANQVSNKFKNLNTVQANVQFQYWDEKGKADKSANMTILLKANLKTKLIRVDIQDSWLEGMIIVWDQPKKTALLYQPVTHMILSGPESKVASSYGINLSDFDVASIMSFDTSQLASIKYLRTEKLNRIDHYVVQISTKQTPKVFQDVWVDVETMLVSRVISYFENGKTQAQVDITNFKENPTFSSTELTVMPKGAKTQKL